MPLDANNCMQRRKIAGCRKSRRRSIQTKTGDSESRYGRLNPDVPSGSISESLSSNEPPATTDMIHECKCKVSCQKDRRRLERDAKDRSLKCEPCCENCAVSRNAVRAQPDRFSFTTSYNFRSASISILQVLRPIPIHRP